MLPGSLVIFAVFFVKPTGMDWLERHPFVSGLIFLLGGYIIGAFLKGLSYMLVTGNVNKKLGTPNKILSGSESRFFKKLDSAFEKQLKEVLIKEWGDDLVTNGNESNLLMLCLRKIQTNSHPALETLGRQVSLHEFFASMIVAIPILSVCLMFRGHLFLGITVLLLTYLALKGFYTFRRQFVVNVYRIFYIQHRQSVSK